MRLTRFIMRSILGVLVVACAVGVLTLVACSDDTSGTGPKEDAAAADQFAADAVADARRDGGDAADASTGIDGSAVEAAIEAAPDVLEDAAADHAVDASDGSDAGDATGANDANDAAPTDAADATSVADATLPDAADAADGADATLPDAADAADAADAVASDDASDSADAAADADLCPPALRAYPTKYVQAFCEGIANCCSGLDAGAFDVPTCESTDPAGGWDETLPMDLGVLCAGHVTFDSDAGSACLAALRAAPCAGMDAASSAAVTTACRAVIGGTIAVDAGTCTSSFECAVGAYCSDPDGGVCLSLVGEGGACSSDDMCRSAGTGRPALYCTASFVDSGTGTCAPEQPNGANCVDLQGNPNDLACAALQCGTDQTCGSISTWSNCPLPIPDAGTE
jgi:hypothetical protein